MVDDLRIARYAAIFNKASYLRAHLQISIRHRTKLVALLDQDDIREEVEMLLTHPHPRRCRIALNDRGQAIDQGSWRSIDQVRSARIPLTRGHIKNGTACLHVPL
ncbi:MAG: hypothetical protein Q8M31_12655 [Beijerinckiaceae bacterium]|nr:hypothetical protein [Beijerinckiaceae bacterium]